MLQVAGTVLFISLLLADALVSTAELCVFMAAAACFFFKLLKGLIRIRNLNAAS